MRAALSGLLCCISVLSAGGGDDPNKADLARLQGTWKVIRVIEDGKPGKTGQTWTIAGNKIPIGGGWHDVFTLNAKANPKAMDFDHVDAGGTVRDKGVMAIYAFDGEDTLKWCTALLSGAPRPKAFASKPGDGNKLVILQRVKK
jgi:uncharacterized protein (TIGR03067 family)